MGRAAGNCLSNAGADAAGGGAALTFLAGDGNAIALGRRNALLGPSDDGPGHPFSPARTVTRVAGFVAGASCAAGAPVRSVHLLTMRKLILCVEDEHLAAEAVRRALGYAGYEVQVAPTAAAALEAMQQRRPDLVLLDLLLPDVNGYSFIDLLRDHGDLDRVPIVIVSGCASPEAQSLGRELGARAYLVKPFTAQELIGCVNCVLGAEAKSGTH